MLTDSIEADDVGPLSDVEAAQLGAALGAIARRRTRRLSSRRDDLPSAGTRAPLLTDAAGWINLAL